MTYSMAIYPYINRAYATRTESPLLGIKKTSVTISDPYHKLDFISEFKYPDLAEVEKIFMEIGDYSSEEVSEIVKASAKLPGYNRG